MEFEEMQKVWITGKQEAVYAFDEKALHNRVRSKRSKILHIANVSELVVILVNLAAGCFIFAINEQRSGNLLLQLLAVWMLLTAVYVLVKRVRRLNETPKFDRPMLEELRYAVATASYQVRLSQLMRLNVLPVMILSVLGVWQTQKSVWFSLGLVVFFAIAYFMSGWEHRIYKNKKKELVLLQDKLAGQ